VKRTERPVNARLPARESKRRSRRSSWLENDGRSRCHLVEEAAVHAEGAGRREAVTSRGEGVDDGG
jgi:hypothetical protein